MASAGTVCVVGSMADPPAASTKGIGGGRKQPERITGCAMLASLALFDQRAAVFLHVAARRESGLVAERGDAVLGVRDLKLAAAQPPVQGNPLIPLRHVAVRGTFERIVHHVAGLRRRARDRLHLYRDDTAFGRDVLNRLPLVGQLRLMEPV